MDVDNSKLQAVKDKWEAFKTAFDSLLVDLSLANESGGKGDGGTSAEDIGTPPQSREHRVRVFVAKQTGNFPYSVGKLVQAAFPELFKRKALSAGDIAYLLSDKASADFKTRGSKVLLPANKANEPELYKGGHRRYYDMKPLELGGSKYYLSSQFFPESREAVLKWIYQHGLKKSELISLVESKFPKANANSKSASE